MYQKDTRGSCFSQLLILFWKTETLKIIWLKLWWNYFLRKKQADWLIWWLIHLILNQEGGSIFSVILELMKHILLIPFSVKTPSHFYSYFAIKLFLSLLEIFLNIFVWNSIVTVLQILGTWTQSPPVTGTCWYLCILKEVCLLCNMLSSGQSLRTDLIIFLFAFLLWSRTGCHHASLVVMEINFLTTSVCYFLISGTVSV